MRKLTLASFLIRSSTALLFFAILSTQGSCTSGGPPASQTESPSARDPDAVPAVTKPLPPTGGSKVLAVTSWNVKHLGREVFNSAQASPLLADADIVTFQEVNTSDKGLSALSGIAAQLQRLIPSERFCMGLSEIPNGAKERYAYLWKNSRISYVKSNGDIMPDCPPSAITIRVSVRNAETLTRPPAVGSFYFKPAARQFVLASVHLPPIRKRPQDEVPALFEVFSTLDHPVIVAGDFNLGASHKVFQVAEVSGFKPALVKEKTSLKQNRRELSKAYDNFWFRKVQMAGTPRVLNLYEIFPEKDQKEIYDNFSDHCPIASRFVFD